MVRDTAITIPCSQSAKYQEECLSAITPVRRLNLAIRPEACRTEAPRPAELNSRAGHRWAECPREL